jgi:class 3 adenylate cyclase
VRVNSVGELPIGTVSFLFTDIEGSTQLVKQLGGERYSYALADHQRILREAFAEHGGDEIDTQGDSFFIAFRRAKDALLAAIACQRRLAAHQWPEGTKLLRMGIHTGEPAMGGQAYVGLGVNRGSRIAAAGHGGQVLTSQTARELLRDDPIPDVTPRARVRFRVARKRARRSYFTQGWLSNGPIVGGTGSSPRARRRSPRCAC